jgi:hypothetical protein
MRVSRTRLVAILLSCLLVPAASASAMPEPAGAPTMTASTASTAPKPQFFAASSPWNLPVPANTALDGSSSTLVGSLVNMVNTYGAGLEVMSYSTPIYTVPATQPTVYVQISPNSSGQVNPDLQRALSAVPIPPGAQPAAGTDEMLVINQPATNTMWELWHAQLESDGWHADWGGRIIDVSQSPGYYEHIVASDGTVLEQPWWGASATSLALADSVITVRDLQNGYIDHALALLVPHPWARAGVVAWPAERTDGISTDPASIPEGAHFRLDPTLNIDSLNLPALTKMIALAAQQYGFIVRGSSSDVTVQGQAPRTANQTSVWQNIMAASGFKYWVQVLQQFPWSHLQLLPMTLSAPQ